MRESRVTSLITAILSGKLPRGIGDPYLRDLLLLAEYIGAFYALMAEGDNPIELRAEDGMLVRYNGWGSYRTSGGSLSHESADRLRTLCNLCPGEAPMDVEASQYLGLAIETVASIIKLIGPESGIPQPVNYFSIARQGTACFAVYCLGDEWYCDGLTGPANEDTVAASCFYDAVWEHYNNAVDILEDKDPDQLRVLRSLIRTRVRNYKMRAATANKAKEAQAQ